METKEIKLQGERLNFGKYSYVDIYHSSSNCKLTTIEYIYNIFSEQQHFKEYFDEVLKKCRICTYLNTNQDHYAEWILKNYEVYSYNKIPVGYNDGYQYHIIIRNTIGIQNSNMRPTEFKKKEVRKSKKALAIAD